MPKKILIVSVGAGAGHVKAAEALEAAFKMDYPNFEVKNIDLLDYSNSLVKFTHGRSYLDLVRTLPELYVFNYKNYELIKKVLRPNFLSNRFNFNRFLKVVDDFNPEVIFATHFIAAAAAIQYKKSKKKKYKVVLSLTDYEFHPLWFVEGVDLFTTATEEVKRGLVDCGADARRVIVSGIPIHLKFSERKDKQKLLAKYGLKNSSPVILVSAGSFGITPLVDVIDELKKIKTNFQLIVVCGQNNKLEKELGKKQKSERRLKKIFGFVDFMDELMAASNLLITKPGGITVSEALAVGLPMILIEPIPGQEEANAVYLCEHGAAMQARNLSALIYKLEQLLAEPKRLSAMARSAKAISYPDAAREIVQKIFLK